MSKQKFTNEELHDNSILKLLNEQELLYYSSEFGDSTKKLFNTRRGKSAAEKITEILTKPKEALRESIAAFHEDYQTMNEVSKELLLQTTKMLIEKKSFEGVTIQLVPKYKEQTRQEDYDFVKKTVSICFYPFPSHSLLYAGLKPTQALMHELTHGLDHALGMPSYKNLLSYLTKPDGVHLVPILEASADLVDATGTLKNQYINPKYTKVDDADEKLTKPYKNENYPNKPFIVAVAGSYKPGDEVQKESGEFPHALGLAEYLTFGTEQISDSIKSSNTVEEFGKQYRNDLQTNLNRIKVPYQTDPKLTVEELRYASLGLLKAAMETHISEMGKSSVLQPYMLKAIETFKTLEYNSFKSTLQSVLETYAEPKLTRKKAQEVTLGIISELEKSTAINVTKRFTMSDGTSVKYLVNREGELELQNSKKLDMSNVPSILITNNPLSTQKTLTPIQVQEGKQKQAFEPEITLQIPTKKGVTQDSDSFTSEAELPEKKLKVAAIPEIVLQSSVDSEKQPETKKRKLVEESEDSIEAPPPLKKPKTEVPDKWYKDRHFSLTSTTVVGSAEQLKINLERLNPGDTLALNVHVLTGDFGGLSHWVGIKKGAVGEVNTFAYIDPTGLRVHKHIEQAIKDQNPAAEIKQVFNEKVKLQHGKIVGSGDRAYFDGNDKDCGPFVVYSLQRLNNAPSIGEGIKELGSKASEISNIEKSKAFGQELREKHNVDLSELNKLADKEKPDLLQNKEMEIDSKSPRQSDITQALSITKKVEELENMDTRDIIKIAEKHKTTTTDSSKPINVRPNPTPTKDKSLEQKNRSNP